MGFAGFLEVLPDSSELSQIKQSWSGRQSLVGWFSVKSIEDNLKQNTASTEVFPFSAGMLTFMMVARRSLITAVSPWRAAAAQGSALFLRLRPRLVP